MNQILTAILYQPIALLLNLFFQLFNNYGVAIFLLTVVFRAIMLPSAIKQQKGTAQQVRLKPKVAKLQKKYANDKQKLQQETQALYAKEGFNPMSAGCSTLILNMVIMIGLYNVIYNPLTYILRLPADVIESAKTALGSSNIGQELMIMNSLDQLPELAGLGIEELKRSFVLFGLDLTQSPSISEFSAIWIIPILSGVLSFLTSFISLRRQKQTNPEMARNPMNGCMTFGMPLFSLYIAFSVPAGVGFYWACSNLVALLQTIFVNKYYSPDKVVAMLFIEEAITRRSKEKRKVKLSAE